MNAPVSAPASASAGAPAPRSAGVLPWVLIALGVAGIIWGAVHVSSAAYGTRALSIEERRSYDQIKEQVHASYFGGLLRGLAGLALAIGGERLRQRRLRS